jgi:hypothetical protein
VRKGAGSEPRGALVARVMGPDGKERTIINVHLAGVDNVEERKKQIDYLAQMVKAETQANPGREVVVMGDFNSSTAEVGAGLEGAGMHREVGGKKETGDNFDQVWVTNNANADTSAQVSTDGASDHKYAGYTVLRKAQTLAEVERRRGRSARDGTLADRLTPVQVTGVSSITSLAAGINHSLARRNDGTAWGWGSSARLRGDGPRRVTSAKAEANKPRCTALPASHSSSRSPRPAAHRARCRAAAHRP